MYLYSLLFNFLCLQRDTKKERSFSKSLYYSYHFHPRFFYNLDENMQSTEEQELKMCYGAYKFLLDNNMLNQQMQLAYRMGLDKDLIESIEKEENKSE